MKSVQLFVILLLISFILFILFQLEWVESKEGLTNRDISDITHEIPTCEGPAEAKPPPCFATIQTDEYLGNSDFKKDDYILKTDECLGTSDFIKDDYILKTKIVTPVCPNDPFMSFRKKDGSDSNDINPSMFNDEDMSTLFRLASDVALAGNRWLSDPTNTENLERSLPGVTGIVKNVINITGLTSDTENYAENTEESSGDTTVNITQNIEDISNNIVNDSFPFIQSDTELSNQPQPSNSPTMSVTEMPIPTLPPSTDSESDISTPQKPVEPEPAQANETSGPQATIGSSLSSPSPIYRVPTGSPSINKPLLGNPPWYSCNRTNGSMDPVPINDDFTRFTQI